MNDEKSMRGEGTQAAAPEVPSAPVQSEGDAMLAEMRKMRADMNAALERQKSEFSNALAERDRELEYLRRNAAQSNASPMPEKAIAPPRNAVEVTNAKLQAHYDRVQSREDSLVEGARKFTVSMEGEPRMTKTVGGQDAIHAKAKWMDFFGVTGHAPEKPVHVIEIGETPAA